MLGINVAQSVVLTLPLRGFEWKTHDDVDDLDPGLQGGVYEFGRPPEGVLVDGDHLETGSYGKVGHPRLLDGAALNSRQFGFS